MAKLSISAIKLIFQILHICTYTYICKVREVDVGLVYTVQYTACINIYTGIHRNTFLPVVDFFVPNKGFRTIVGHPNAQYTLLYSANSPI